MASGLPCKSVYIRLNNVDFVIVCYGIIYCMKLGCSSSLSLSVPAFKPH